ncbi:MAG: hypothetical protein AAF266_02715 [Planctomycetota bacterium]
MDDPHRELWRRIEAFELDDPQASLTFSRRLARENGWEHEFARRVVDEYKRFVFLAMTAGHQVTPSDEVDQAWHLHLTYTRSYWGELCGEVLDRPLHHGPTKGGKQEGERFEDQYERTLASYRDAFGFEPPSDIWPPSDIRFGEATDFVRVNTQRVWLLQKPFRIAPRTTLVAGLSGVGLVLPLAQGEATAAIVLGVPLSFFLIIAIVSLRPGSSDRRNRRDRGSSGCGGFFGWGGCSSGGDGGGDSGCGGGGCGGCGGCGG